MTHYTAPLRDLKFALYDVIGAQALYARLGIGSAQREILDAVMDEAAKFTQTVLAPLNAGGDEHGCRFDPATGDVTTPPGFRDAFAQFVAGGWTGLTAPEAMGGQDEMHDVVGEVVLAAGDEDLRAGDRVAAVGLLKTKAEPQCGSVRHIVPVQRPSMIACRNTSFCHCWPWCLSASIAPCDSSG